MACNILWCDCVWWLARLGVQGVYDSGTVWDGMSEAVLGQVRFACRLEPVMAIKLEPRGCTDHSAVGCR